jgi:hypothetical protein
MIKIEIKYPNGRIVRRRFKKLKAAMKWWKVFVAVVK